MKTLIGLALLAALGIVLGIRSRGLNPEPGPSLIAIASLFGVQFVTVTLLLLLARTNSVQ